MALAHAARPFCRGEIAVSEAVGRILRSRLHLPARRVTVISNGCSTDEIAARAAEGRNAAAQRARSGNARVFMPSRICPPKDHATALRAIHSLRSEGRDVQLCFAGGALREVMQARIESLMDELGIRDLVQFLGVRDDVPELMGASDIVLHATKSEGFGMVVVEAMAAGVPVIATDIPVCREVLDGGRCGLLVPLGDFVALAAAIRRLRDDEPLRARLVQAASERVRTHYDVRQMAAGYAKLLRGRAEKAVIPGFP